MAPQACSRSRVIMEKPSYQQRMQRLEQSRITFSAVGRSKAGVFRESQAKVSEEQLFGHQVREMHEVEERLRQLRLQYDKVCRERGKAHQSAVLVKNQEQEIAEFEKRRNDIVRKRAERVARKEALVHKQRLTEKSRQKQEQLERRKNVFQTDWSPSDDPLRWTDKRTFAHELEQLIGLEKTIEQKVREKTMQQRKKQTAAAAAATKTTFTKLPAQRSCPGQDSSCSCASSSCSCSGSSTPVSEFGSVICVEEIAQRVYLKLESMKRRAAPQQKLAFPRPAPQSKNTALENDRPKQSKHVREVGVNTSRPANNNSSPDAPFVLCSSPSTSFLSGPDDGKQHFIELMQKLNDLSAIESPNDDENVSSFTSAQTVTKNPVTRPKRLDTDSEHSEVRDRGSPVAAEPDISSSSHESSVPKFPSFDRSYFWKDVFDSAGVSMSETIARVLRDAKRTTENIEKSLTLLSIPEPDISQITD